MSGLHERVSVNALAFPGEPLGEIAGYFRRLEPKRIGFVSPQLEEAPLEEVRRLFGGYPLDTIMHPFAARLAEPETWEGPRGRLAEVIRTAEALGSRTIYLTTGSRGDLTWEAAAQAFADALAPCRAQAQAAGVQLLVEPAPILYAELHIAHSLRDTVLLAEIAGIGVCIDLFPCWAEAGLAETIRRAGPRIGLVQLGDYVLGDRAVPSRAIVGEGDIPLKRIFGWILETGFAGGFDLELIGPRIEAAGRFEAVRRSAEATGDILRALGA